MLSRRLERKGYTVAHAEDGQVALDMVRKNIPDLILMDMNLPVMDGWETCKAIRDEFPDETLPIIALTAHAMSGDREKALAAGCDDYATKPVDFKVLVEKITALTKAI